MTPIMIATIIGTGMRGTDTRATIMPGMPATTMQATATPEA
ncbi:hypothetical protein [Pandoraea vervacti]|nr:hypothetical protein [Pandoraea vervacti]